MLEKYQSEARELLKYLRDIRLAASRSIAWHKYDEQFRFRKAFTLTTIAIAVKDT